MLIYNTYTALLTRFARPAGQPSAVTPLRCVAAVFAGTPSPCLACLAYVFQRPAGAVVQGAVRHSPLSYEQWAVARRSSHEPQVPGSPALDFPGAVAEQRPLAGSRVIAASPRRDGRADSRCAFSCAAEPARVLPAPPAPQQCVQPAGNQAPARMPDQRRHAPGGL